MKDFSRNFIQNDRDTIKLIEELGDWFGVGCFSLRLANYVSWTSASILRRAEGFAIDITIVSAENADTTAGNNKIYKFPQWYRLFY